MGNRLNLPSSISFLAPAKLNLSLHVFGRRPDGYHDIRSVMVPVSLYDEVIVEKIPEGIVVECDEPGVPADETNSCHRAASLFREWAGFPWGVRIVIRKRIPAEAGLGGGSSDAAATLKCLCVLTGLHPPPGELLAVAARVGADVPFFTLGSAALVEGFGDVLTPMSLGVPFHAVIVKPPFGMSTREGYARLRRSAMEPPPKGTLPVFPDLSALAAAVRNDFENAWSHDYPEIREIKGELLSEGAVAATLSGSGSAVFGLFRSGEEARDALARVAPAGEARGRRCFAVRSIP
jgi:4-diphosphocytidyl-2-C-methyl-D-erythritol kinase